MPEMTTRSKTNYSPPHIRVFMELCPDDTPIHWACLSPLCEGPADDPPRRCMRFFCADPRGVRSLRQHLEYPRFDNGREHGAHAAQGRDRECGRRDTRNRGE